MQLPLDFFTNLFFKRDKNHQKILKNNKDYNSLTKEKYDTFYKYFFKPFIKELETLYKNQYLQNSDKVISNLDEELFKEKLKTFITRNFYSLTPTYKLMFGELITFIYVTSYQLDWCGIRTTDNFDQLNCFKILFKDYNFGEENTIFTHETKNIIEIIEWFKKTNIWFLSIIKEMRNLVSHGSFFISTNIDITNIVHYYSYYNDFPTWKKPIINNLKTLGCSIEQREISFCNKVLSTWQKRLDNNALSMMKDSLNTFSKNQFYLDPRYWLNNSIFSELTKLSLKELLDIDLYLQKDINDLSSFLDSIYVDDVIKKFAKKYNISNLTNFKNKAMKNNSTYENILKMTTIFSFSLLKKTLFLTPFVSSNTIVNIFIEIFIQIQKYKENFSQDFISKTLVNNVIKIFFVDATWKDKIKKYCINNIISKIKEYKPNDNITKELVNKLVILNTLDF